MANSMPTGMYRRSELAGGFPKIMRLSMMQKLALPPNEWFLNSKGLKLTMETIRSHKVKSQKGQVQRHS